ncbi:MAG: hypothetical protein V2J26_05515 [Pacificimonas sp.]|jgi:hypothetical protein|nr:hypothetical protein [Pacificimonas sp.]
MADDKETGGAKEGAIGCLLILLLFGGCVWWLSDEEPTPDEFPEARMPTEDNPFPQGEAAKNDALALWQSVVGFADPCDDAAARAQQTVNQLAAGEGTRIESYRVANDASQICSDAWQSISRLKVPESIEGRVRADLAEALKTCDTTMFLRKESYEKMATVIDGDSSPSLVVAFQDDTEMAQTSALLCGSRFIGAMLKLGVDAEEMDDLP